MSYTYRINKELKLNYVKASGSVHVSEIIETARKMFRDPDWKFVRKQISDFREATGLIITFEGFEKIIEVEKEQQEEQEKIHNGETGKLAIVAEKDIYDIIFELYSVKTKDGFHKTKIFNNIDQALVWLELISVNDIKENNLNSELTNLIKLKNSK